MKADKVSLVIRTMNERAELAAWLDYFEKNSFAGDLEIIVADNESTDGTVELAQSAGCKVASIPRNDFSYPRQLNTGIALATGELVAVVVAHAYPLRADWLQNGLRHFSDPGAVGVYAANYPGKGASVTEWIFYGIGYLVEKARGVRKVGQLRMGTFGATNLIIRRSAWQENPFDERYGSGGEDYQWAKWALSRGYSLVMDPDFSVRHSHGLGFSAFMKQYRHWQKVMVSPAPFERANIRYKKHLGYESEKIDK